jgi:hypothetical protein
LSRMQMDANGKGLVEIFRSITFSQIEWSWGTQLFLRMEGLHMWPNNRSLHQCEHGMLLRFAFLFISRHFPQLKSLHLLLRTLHGEVFSLCGLLWSTGKRRR